MIANFSLLEVSRTSIVENDGEEEDSKRGQGEATKEQQKEEEYLFACLLLLGLFVVVF